MKKTTLATIVLGLLGFVSAVNAQTGTMPIPQIDTALVETTVEIVEGVGGVPTQYIYRYTVTNPATSSNSLYKFSLDISGIGRDFRRPTLVTVPKAGGQQTRPFEEEIDFFFPFFGPNGDGVVPIGLECPPGWNGGLRKNATVVCYSSNDAPEIAPGESMSGFAVHSRFPPMLRELDNTAFWTVVVESLDDDILDIDREAAYEVLEDLRRPQTALGPSYIFPSDRRHYTFFERDLAEMIALGWIPNTMLADELVSIVDDAGELFNTAQGTAAKQRLFDVLTALENSTDADIRPEAAAHLSVNVDSIQEFGANTLPSGGLRTRYRVTPLNAQLKPGDTLEIEVFVFRLNNFDFETGLFEEPLTNRTVYFACPRNAPVPPGVDPCPNHPDPNVRIAVPVDANAIARYSVTGNVGDRDYIDICGDSFCEGVEATVVVDWVSDVDLVVSAFSPPLIKAESGEVILFTDRTANFGDGPSGASVTRFYISDTEDVDPATATVVGERTVPPLQPGEVSEQTDTTIALPPGFPLGVHNLIACADAAEEIRESNELNNCSNAQLEGSEFIAIPVADFEDLTRVSADDVSIEEGDSGTTDALVEVVLSQGDPNADIIVSYEIEDGSATVVDNDYVDSSGTITFPAGSGAQSQSIIVSVVGDDREEDDETLVVRLGSVSGEFVLFDREAVVTIVNDDADFTLDCSTATAFPSLLWPPNHKYTTIDIAGVLDRSGNEANISVQQVFQDELLNGEGDGDTEPDAVIDAVGDVQVRSERSGLEDGRIYEITFEASSNDGATCTGTVFVGVPHDQGQGSTPIDSGVRFDSTISAN